MSKFKEIALGEVSFITKLAGFEHTEYIQPNATKNRVNHDDVPMYIGMNIKNSKLTKDIYWFLPNNISQKLYRSALTKKCLVLPYVGSVGDIAIFDSNERHHLASNVAKIELNDEALFSIEYLYYYLKSPFGQKQLLFYIQGGIQKNITMDAIRKTVIKINNNEKDIVKILSTLDAKIELNNKINTELEAMAKTLYDYWFLQFDFPDKNGKPYKSSGGEMVWSEELKRKIPKGWKVDMINTKVKIGSGFPFDSNDYCDNGEYKIITIKNVQDGFLDTSTIDKIDFIPQKINDFCILKIGDVLMSLTGNVGRMCFVDQEKLLLNQRVGKLIGDKDFVIYAYLFFQRPENQARLNKIAGGSSQSNLSPIDAVKDFFVIPPKQILDNFSKIINPIFDQIVKNKQGNQQIAELRDFLLPMLMNGQVVVE